MTATTFDIHADVFTDGDLDEEATHRYERDLVKLFEDSPEGRALAAEGLDPGFAGQIVRYLLGYEGVSVPEMTDVQFEGVLFELIPEKVVAEPEEARAMILEARAFCRYLERAHGLDNAQSCLAIVEGDDAIEALEAALANPRRWGMAKSLVMQGKARGFDVSSKEGLDEWFSAYNASLPALRPLPGAVAATGRKDAGARRKKRKQQKAARRKNR